MQNLGRPGPILRKRKSIEHGVEPLPSDHPRRADVAVGKQRAKLVRRVERLLRLTTSESHHQQ